MQRVVPDHRPAGCTHIKAIGKVRSPCDARMRRTRIPLWEETQKTGSLCGDGETQVACFEGEGYA